MRMTLLLVTLLSLAASGCAHVPAGTAAKPELETLSAKGINVHLLYGDKVVVVDTGYPGGEGKIIRAIERRGYTAQDVSLIVVTHAHADHAGSAKALHERTGAPVVMGAQDAALSRRGHNDALHATGTPGRFVKRFTKVEYPAFEPGQALDGAMDLTGYGVEGIVVPTGGHTLGSTAVVLDDGRALVGDLVRGKVLAPHKPTTHFFHRDTGDAHEALRALLDENQLTTLYAGHAGPLPAAAVRSWLEVPRSGTRAGVRQEHRTVQGSRGTVFEQRWVAPGVVPRGVVVLLHGLLDHSSRYDAFARGLVARGFAVYALDHQGHGRSEGERGYVERFADAQQDVARTLGWARQEHADVPVFLFGHSMGGALATQYVLDHPGELDGLVLSGAAVGLDPKAGDALIRLTTRLSEKRPNARVLRLRPRRFSRDKAVVAAMKKDPLVDRRKIPARTAGEIIAATRDIEQRAGELSLPMLVMHGGADRVTPPQGSAALVERAASTDKQLLRFEGLVHDLLHEPERAVVQDAVGEWLEARTTAGP